MTKKKQQVEKKKAKKMKKTARPFVEMETDLSSYDDDAVYPVDDDPYRGRRRPVLVEFMALDLVVCGRLRSLSRAGRISTNITAAPSPVWGRRVSGMETMGNPCLTMSGRWRM